MKPTPKRKKTSNGTAKYTAALNVRCTETQRRRFDKLATQEGLSTSTWARVILVRAIADPGNPDAAPRS